MLYTTQSISDLKRGDRVSYIISGKAVSAIVEETAKDFVKLRSGYWIHEEQLL